MILKPGINCWKRAAVNRAAYLIDADSYFRALASALSRARKSIWIVGWDTDSKVKLVREPDGPGLEGFLTSLVGKEPELEVRVLSWDFAMVFALERELRPLFRLSWSSHERLQYHLDAEHPVGASHHQKLVVVDDRVAFAGGIDVTKRRWDTSEHRLDEPGRTYGGKRYPPFHDVHMAVDGDAAAALGELARERWHRATGSRVPPAEVSGSDPWPSDLEPDVEDGVVGIARTLPEYNGTDPVREVERLYLDAIGAARDSVYLENQYFTSLPIARALAKRLAEADGPEVVAVIPESCRGWLEESTMGVLRNRCLDELSEADRYGRFRAYYPVVGEESVFVHAKVMVVDDRLARVGSANLSNRSMGLDTECDLAIEAREEEGHAAVGGLRSRLVAEHLGVSPGDVAEGYSRSKSLLSTIEKLSSGDRCLKPVAIEAREEEATAVVAAEVVDPERPIEPDLLVDDFLEDDSEPVRRLGRWRGGLLLAAMVGLAILWKWGPLGEWLTVERLSQWASWMRGEPWSLLIVVLVYVVSGVLMVPLTLLILATAATFGGWLALLYALAGTMASAMLTFWLGHLIGRDVLRSVVGKKLNRVSKKLARRGVLAVATARLFPLAPYGVVNMVAGASHIGFRDFAVGTFLGVLPGIAALCLLESQIESALSNPGVASIVGIAVLLGLLVASGMWVRRRLSTSSG